MVIRIGKAAHEGKVGLATGLMPEIRGTEIHHLAVELVRLGEVGHPHHRMAQMRQVDRMRQEGLRTRHHANEQFDGGTDRIHQPQCATDVQAITFFLRHMRPAHLVPGQPLFGHRQLLGALQLEGNALQAGLALHQQDIVMVTVARQKSLAVVVGLDMIQTHHVAIKRNRLVKVRDIECHIAQFFIANHVLSPAAQLL